MDKESKDCTHKKITSFKIDKPYPKVKANEKDKKYLPIILENYSGKISEFTAISQYIYSHFTVDYLGEKNSLILKISDAFEKIAIVEMHHLELLADVITEIGGNPKFVDCSNIPWNSTLVPYGKTVESNIKLALKSELEAIEQYRYTIAKIDNKSIKMLIYRIIEDELLHIKIFKKLLEELKC